MGCWNSKSADDDKHTIKARYTQFHDISGEPNHHITLSKDPNYINAETYKTNNQNKTQLEDSEYEYEYEESEDESDNSYLNDSDYYNKKARLKSKFMPFILTKEEKQNMLGYKIK